MYIFISYSSKNTDEATNICKKMEKAGQECFLAYRDIAGGSVYAEELVNAIDKSDAVLLLLSEGSNSSPHVLREVERSCSKNIPIIVYKMEDVVLTKSLEYFLMTHQWVTKDDDDERLIGVFRNLEKRQKETKSTVPVNETASAEEAHAQSAITDGKENTDGEDDEPEPIVPYGKDRFIITRKALYISAIIGALLLASIVVLVITLSNSGTNQPGEALNRNMVADENQNDGKSLSGADESREIAGTYVLEDTKKASDSEKTDEKELSVGKNSDENIESDNKENKAEGVTEGKDSLEENGTVKDNDGAGVKDDSVGKDNNLTEGVTEGKNSSEENGTVKDNDGAGVKDDLTGRDTGAEKIQKEGKDSSEEKENTSDNKENSEEEVTSEISKTVQKMQPGDCITIGSYREKPIEWVALHKNDDGSTILISKDILCLKMFDAPESGEFGTCTDQSLLNGEAALEKAYWTGSKAEKYGSEALIEAYGNNDWSVSNIRCWLNADKNLVHYEDMAPGNISMGEKWPFYNDEKGFLKNFTDEEKSALAEYSYTYVNSITGEKKKLSDKVFLLSEKELDWFFSGDISPLAKVFETAVAEDYEKMYENYNNNGYYFWWLRDGSKKAACMNRYVSNNLDELVFEYLSSYYGYGGVRPCICIK